MREQRLHLALLALGGALALIWGWRTFWFLTDDAYIAFRYVSNDLLGHGWVWNAAPFRPVEGYTSFLWVVLLDGVWRVFGVEPPDSANTISLVCAAVTLWLGSVLIWRARLPVAWHAYRVTLIAVLLLGTLCNRTFLAWSSSGLETALFNMFLLGWVVAMVRIERSTTQSASGWAVAAGVASAMALTRPDGLLFLAVTTAVGGCLAWRNEGRNRQRVLVRLAVPAIVVAGHLFWRKSTYGFWLPNTYFAKVAAPWPEAGLRYLQSFVLEYAVWAWVPLLLAVVWSSKGRAAIAGLGLATQVAIATLLLHVAYYVFLVGGDHFEYRVLSQLVMLLLVAASWLAAWSSLRPAAGIAVLLAGVALSLPLPWTHFAITRHLETREETHRLYAPLTPHFPVGARWYTESFDRSQAWLVGHYVGLRHQEHKINLAALEAIFPNRDEGARIKGANPVLRYAAVGYAAWSLPHVNVLDAHGLNDVVVARSPGNLTRGRQMAHEHTAPPEYVRCFDPDVVVRLGRVVRIARKNPMTALRIERCEERWWAALGLALD